MSSAKRIYLCNLFPLWEKDDERLAVDWVREEATAGSLVELRVLVKDRELRADDSSLSIRFEIYESDFLLSGGLDDHVATFGTEASGGDKYEHRALRALQPPAMPNGDAEQFIFLSPVRASGDTRGGTQVRAFWKAVRDDDVWDDPEFYFDVTVVSGSEEMEERSDRELRVTPEGHSADDVALADLRREGDPVVVAAGWNKERAPVGEDVDLIAIVRGGQPGCRLTFDILQADLLEGDALHRIDLPLGASPVVRTTWRIPDRIPLPGVSTLRFDVNVMDDTESSSGTASVPELGGGSLHGTLQLVTHLRLQLVDTQERPVRNARCAVLRAADASKAAEGVTDQDGNLDVRDLPAGDYDVEVQSLAVIGASEPEVPVTRPDPSHVMFTFVDVRGPAPTPEPHDA
jgi:hypothetical protein